MGVSSLISDFYVYSGSGVYTSLHFAFMIIYIYVDCFIYFFFFFQAEDGIRDLVRSRGLGDVYKRQVIMFSFRKFSETKFLPTRFR